MKRGLFAQDAYDFSEVLGIIHCGVIDGFKVDADWFLHGECGIFALALHDALGYDLERMMEPDSSEEGMPQLVHIYCRGNDGAYIDVRGTCPESDKDLFFESEFGDWYTNVADYSAVDGEDLKQSILQFEMSQSTFAQFYNLAIRFIEQHREWYKAEQT